MNYLASTFQRIKKYAVTHKLISAVIVLVLLGGGYYVYTKIYATSAGTQYVLGRVRKGDIAVTVSGSGQVATLNAVDIKPQTTGQTQTLGQIISVNVKNGDTVKAGQVIAVLDGKTALQTLKQQQASVESAQANYDKLVNGATDSDLQSYNNAVANNTLSVQNAAQNLQIKVQSAYASVSNLILVNTDPIFSSLPPQGPQINVPGVYFSNQQLQINVQSERLQLSDILTSWSQAMNATTTDLISSTQDDLNKLITVRNYFDDMTMLFSSNALYSSTNGQASISTYKTVASSARASVIASINDLTTSLQNYQNAQITLAQSQTSLAFKKAPANVDDVTVAKSQLDNAKAALSTAEQTYASRIITAPFDGQIGGLNAQIGQQVSSSDSLGKVITADRVVNITLNEVDAAKVQPTDPVQLTFDALPDLTIPGHINYIDPLGTVVQGVVSYSVQVILDSQNDQIKTGMTASAQITTDSHTGVMIVPSSAVSSTGNQNFVLVVDASTTAPTLANLDSASSTVASSSWMFASSTGSTNRTRVSGGVTVPSTSVTTHKVPVVVGLTDNTNTEIVSGLNPGDRIVVRTILNSTAASTKTVAAAATTNTRATGRATGGLGAGVGAAIR